MITPNLHDRRWSCTLVCFLLFAAALCRYWVHDLPEPVPHDPESFRLARNIAEKGEFANPFIALDTGPSAHLAPAFPGFLALLIRLFGDGSAGMYAIKLAAAIILSTQVALFPVFSRALGMGELNGTITAGIWIAVKPGFIYGFEAVYVGILMAIAVCYFRWYLDSPPAASTGLAWLLGCVGGLLMITSPTASVIFLGFFGLLLWRDKLAIFKRSSLLTIVLLSALIVAPWTIRNFVVFHRFILVRDNLGLELSVSNNDYAAFGIYQNFANGCFKKTHPNLNVDEARKVLANGEPEYNELKLQEALSWIKSHPAKFLSLSAMRVAAFWEPASEEGAWWSVLGVGRRLERLPVLLMTLLSVPGLFMLYRRDRLGAWLCLICLGLYPVVYYFVQYEYRYRVPILWVTFLLGSLPITAFARYTYVAISNGVRNAMRGNGAEELLEGPSLGKRN
jgi:hypothetical protein